MKLFDKQQPLKIHRTAIESIYILLSVVLLSSGAQLAFAQNLKVNQPDVERPVPQYVPRYPLQESPGQPATKIAPVEQPAQIKSAPKPPVKPVQKRPTLEPIRPLAPQPPEPAAVIDYSIYRDSSRYPVDPRKPCNECVRPDATLPRCSCDLPGWKGRPNMDKEPGGCLCGKKRSPKHSEFSVYWPRPFSARLDNHFPEKAAERYEPCQKKRLVDVFDSLSTFKLINYQRKDNGYCGRGVDPYGCLGESRYSSRVAGINDEILRVRPDRELGN